MNTKPLGLNSPGWDEHTEAARRCLVLCRSDEGNGGWSLHTHAQVAEMERSGDAIEILHEGTAKWNDDIGYRGGWDRPNAEDYAEAKRLMESQTDR